MAANATVARRQLSFVVGSDSASSIYVVDAEALAQTHCAGLEQDELRITRPRTDLRTSDDEQLRFNRRVPSDDLKPSGKMIYMKPRKA